MVDVTRVEGRECLLCRNMVPCLPSEDPAVVLRHHYIECSGLESQDLPEFLLAFDRTTAEIKGTPFP